MLALVLLVACNRPDDASPMRFSLDLHAGSPRQSSRPVPVPRGPLAPGTYVTSLLRPKLTFTVGEGWTTYGEKDFDFTFDYGFDDAEFSRIDVYVLRPDADVGVLDPAATWRAAVPADVEARANPVPADLRGYLATIPQLAVGPASPIELGGLSGTTFTVTQTALATEPCPDAVDCYVVLLWEPRANLGTDSLTIGQQWQVYVLDHPEGSIVLFWFLPASAAFRQATEDVFATMRFG